MIKTMSIICEKRNWADKVFDDTTTARWKAEVLAQNNNLMSERAFDYVRYPAPTKETIS